MIISIPWLQLRLLDAAEHPTDSWVRIHVAKGDLLVVPAGIYHRFSLDNSEYMKVMRLFKVSMRPDS